MAMYAIVATGGKQMKVSPGMLLDVEKLPGKPGEKVVLKGVLALKTDSDFLLGRPVLGNAQVLAEVVGTLKGPKVISFKFKRRKGYHRKVGHRQPLTRLKILEIQTDGAH